MRRALPLLALAAAGLAVLPGAGGRGGAPPPTYYRDVAPILDAKCAGCHRLGSIAPFPLTTAAQAKAHAAAIAAMTSAGVMPPWLPGADSPRFVGQAQRRLTPRELETLARWAAAGAPLGSRSQARAHPVAGPALTGPGRTLALAPPRPYLPHATGGATDDYHCFLLDPRLPAGAYVTGAEIRPQRAAIVHHVILYEAVGGQVAAAERLDAASGGRGWSCFGGPGLPLDLSGADAALRLGSPEWLAAWVPGHVTDSLPAGTGVLLPAGAKIVMQVHYNLLHGARPDRSRVFLRLRPASTPLRALHTMLVAAPVELPCPAGASGPLCTRAAALATETARYGAGPASLPDALLRLCGKTLADYPVDVGAGTTIGTSCNRAIDEPLTIYGVAGHMHLRGRDVSLVLDPGTPRQRMLLHIPRWDFHWQDAYYLRTPVHVGPGDTLRLACTFDNSGDAQPRYVLWGEGTTDEMCLGVLAVGLG